MEFRVPVKENWKNQLPYIGDYELGIHKSPAKKLSEILSLCTVEQLKYYFYNYNIDETGLPSKKEELAEAAEKLITENCANHLIYDEEITFDFYQQYLNCRDGKTGICVAGLCEPKMKECNDKSEILMYILKSGNVKRFLNKGLLFKFDSENGEETFVIADEVYEKVTGLIQKDGTHPFGSMHECKEFADMLLSIYGVLTVRDFKTLWESAYPKFPMSREEIIEFMRASSKDDFAYNFYEGKSIISHIVLNENQAQEILDSRANYTLFVPSRENLLAWFEDSKNPDTTDAFDSHGKFEFEYKNPHFIRMKRFLEKTRKEYEDSADILTDIMFYIKDGFRMAHVVNILNEDYELTEELSERETQEFFEIYQELHNSTHLWVNYGSTPNDLFDQNAPDLRYFSPQDFLGQNQSLPDIVTFPKVGRNEPCPCGSGKKYKHCHGK